MPEAGCGVHGDFQSYHGSFSIDQFFYSFEVKNLCILSQKIKPSGKTCACVIVF